MYFIETASFFLILVLLHALIGKLGALRGLSEAKKHAIILRDLTGIPRRADLVARFGPHDADYLFDVPASAVLTARPWWRWIFGNVVLEAALIIALVAVALGALPATPLVPALAASYSLASHIIIFRGNRAAFREVEEEVAHKEAVKRARRTAALAARK
jgi:hypothetical protein